MPALHKIVCRKRGLIYFDPQENLQARYQPDRGQHIKLPNNPTTTYKEGVLHSGLMQKTAVSRLR